MAQQDRPFTDTDFSFMLESQPVKGAPYPGKAGFGPAGKKCKWFMILNHPDMKNREGGPAKSFTVTFGFDVMDHILQTLKYIATLPFSKDADPISREIPLNFPKKGEGPKFSGTALRVGRDKTGRIYMSWTDRKIPKVGFFFKSPSMSGLTEDGAPVDVAVDSMLGALRLIEHYSTRVASWKDEVIVIEDPSAYSGGGNGGYNKGGNGGGYNKPQAPAPAYDDDGGDDDVPF